MSVSVHLTHNVSDLSSWKNQVGALQVVTRTWNRDSHDLFDYEAQQVNSQQFQLDGRSAHLVRRENEILVIPFDQPLPLEGEYIASILTDKLTGGFRVVQKEGQLGKKLWSIVKENSPQGVRLAEGDVVKLGRFKLRVRQICTGAEVSDDKTSCSSYHGGTSSSCPKSPQGDAINTLYPDLRIGSPECVIQALTCADAQKDPSIKQFQCRICLSEGPCVDDPLVCPCECTGSIRYVHTQCLGHWLRGRLGLENHTGCTYFYRPLACELCHCTYPVYYNNNGTPVSLAFLPETSVPFVVLENIGGAPLVPAWNTDYSNTFPSGLHVVRFEGRSSVRLGRGHDCEMRISDVSISRLHAELRLAEDGSLHLVDKESKFGTLLGTDNQTIVVDHQTRIAFQSGRTVVGLSVQTEETDAMMVEDQTDEELRPHTH